MASESQKTIYLALGANLGIAVAKGVGGAVSGSTAMLAEAAHSVADTTNQILLLASLRLAEREPDATHPFGYGKERFFWSFLAAVFIFVSGALFSVYEGVHRMLSGESEHGRVWIAFVVLAIGLVLEGSSLIRAVRQTGQEAEAKQRTFSRQIAVTRDPTVKTVVFEDSAAVIGLVLAAAALGLSVLTGSALWDGLGSVCIGVLLALVAFRLGKDSKALLIGTSALPEEREAIAHVLESNPGVDALVELLTMAVGPQSLLVAVRFDLAEGLDSDGVEDLAAELDAGIREVVPDVTHVFLDPTSRREQQLPDAV